MPHVGLFSKVIAHKIRRQDFMKPITPYPRNILMKTDLEYFCAFKLNLFHI